MVHLKTLSDMKLAHDLNVSAGKLAVQTAELQQRCARPLTVDELVAIDKAAAGVEKQLAKLREQAQTARSVLERS